MSIDVAPEDVHEKGLNEVSRLRSSMAEVMNKVNFAGSIQQFFDELRKNKQFYHTQESDLLQEYEQIIEKRIKPKINQMFHKLPAVDCSVRSMPNDGPLGFYNPPTEDGSRSGEFLVNLTHPCLIPRFGMLSLSLHEVNPGHHTQSCYAQQLPLPRFRKKIDYRNIYSSPMLFPVYTAYCEGWAMYAEDLGIEMGVYSTPYEVFGKLTDEMYRACRLVVDTGLHYFGWSKERAIDYMAENCMMTTHKIENEIDRYITWPGQACSYKIGQMKIQELRKLVEHELGSQFDIRVFHDMILNMSSVPLNILDKHIKKWIESQCIKT